MLLGSFLPSPLPSAPQPVPSGPPWDQVEGMNCIGPTARSCVVSPSKTPWSVSAIIAKPLPFSCGPVIRWRVVPSASTAPPRAWPDSTLPMAASSCQGSRQPGSDWATRASAFLYASRTVAGIPASAGPVAAGPPVPGEPPGLTGLFRGGRSV